MVKEQVRSYTPTLRFLQNMKKLFLTIAYYCFYYSTRPLPLQTPQRLLPLQTPQICLSPVLSVQYPTPSQVEHAPVPPHPGQAELEELELPIFNPGEP